MSWNSFTFCDVKNTKCIKFYWDLTQSSSFMIHGLKMTSGKLNFYSNLFYFNLLRKSSTRFHCKCLRGLLKTSASCVGCSTSFNEKFKGHSTLNSGENFTSAVGSDRFSDWVRTHLLKNKNIRLLTSDISELSQVFVWLTVIKHSVSKWNFSIFLSDPSSL